MHRPDLFTKLSIYNDYYQDKPNFQISFEKNENGEETDTLKGNLRIFWGILQPIRLKLKDEEQTTEQINRHSFANESQLETFLKLPKSSNSNIETVMESVNECLSPTSEERLNLKILSPVSRSQSNVVMRTKRKRPVRKRLSIINGHLFSTETSMFTPMQGSLTNVNVTSLDATDQVIKLLLDKFKVDNSPSEFCLCAVKSSGETRIFNENNVPLIERIFYGPLEDAVKFYLIEKYRVVDVNEEVANFVHLPDAVLEAFLIKYQDDEKLEREMIKDKFRIYKAKIEELMENMAPATPST